MGIVTASSFGAGTRLTVNDADPFSYIMDEVLLYQTAANNSAVVITAANGELSVAGSVVSRFYGISADVSDSTSVHVLDTGYVEAEVSAFRIFGAGDFTLTNSGVIEGRRAIEGTQDVDVKIVNSGVIRASDGLSAISLRGGRDTISNSGEINGSIFLGGGNDRVSTSGIINGFVFLEEGDDQFDGTNGMVVGNVEGGAGNDTYLLNRDIELVEDEDEGRDTVFASFDYALKNHFEWLVLRGQAIRGFGNDEDNVIQGNGQDNILRGGGGDDDLNSSDGDDDLQGGSGADFLRGGSGDDRLIGGAGDDTLRGSAGADLYSGGGGLDIAYLDEDGIAPIVVDLTAQTVSGGADEGDAIVGIEGVLTGLGDDTVTGSSADNALFGNAGDDVLAGLGGDDELSGMQGADQINGGLGIDTAAYTFSAAGVNVNLATGAASGGDAAGDAIGNVENLIGSQMNDVLTGDDGANLLEGFFGDDRLNGGAGGDTASYERHTEGVTVRLIAGAQDTLGAGIDTLISIEHLTGSAFDDTLRGSAGANVLTGGGGGDRLTGLGGADLFRYVDSADSTADARDQILDFSKADGDRIGLNAIDADEGVAGNQAFAFIGAAAFSGAGGELRVVYNGDIAVAQADTDGDGAADLVLRIDGTTAAVPLAASDFAL